MGRPRAEAPASISPSAVRVVSPRGSLLRPHNLGCLGLPLIRKRHCPHILVPIFLRRRLRLRLGESRRTPIALPPPDRQQRGVQWPPEQVQDEFCACHVRPVTLDRGLTAKILLSFRMRDTDKHTPPELRRLTFVSRMEWLAVEQITNFSRASSSVLYQRFRTDTATTVTRPDAMTLPSLIEGGA